ncbi:MAG: DUF4389 domain-containing protein [Pseudomonadota bacterium]
MPDKGEFDDVMPENTARPNDKGPLEEGLGARALTSVILWVMIQLAQTVILFVTVVQFVFLLIENKRPNRRLARFGEDVGIWVAKAARYQAGASEVKPWPWTELD